MTTPPALLLVGHGTHDDDGAAALRSLVAELSGRNPGLPVAGGLGKQSPPPLADVVGELTHTGATRVVALPLTLGTPGSAVRDLETALAREAGRRGDGWYACAQPLGAEPTLLGLLEERLDAALGGEQRTPVDRAATTVLLVGCGTADPDANAEVHRAARLLWEGSGYAGVETAFLSQAAPDVASGLDRCRALGAERVVVLPYFLFAGALPDRVRLQADGWAAAHPETEVVTAEVIGPGEALAELVEERYRETVARAAQSRCVSCGERPAARHGRTDAGRDTGSDTRTDTGTGAGADTEYDALERDGGHAGAH